MAGFGARLRSFGAFWWDFVVGDDWRMAVGVVIALGVTAVLSHLLVPAWWVVPVAALGVLASSLVVAVRRRTREDSRD